MTQQNRYARLSEWAELAGASLPEADDDPDDRPEPSLLEPTANGPD